MRFLLAVGLGIIVATPSASAAVSSNLYVSDWTQGAVSTFSIGAGGLLSQEGTGITSTGSQPAGVAISPSGQDLYVANKNQGTVSTFSIGAEGALTQVGPPVLSGDSNSTTNSQPFGVAVAPNGANLYVANYASGTVSTFSIGTNGVLTQQGTGITSGSAGPSWVAISPNGQNLYATNYDAGTVSTFSIGTGGILAPEGTPVSTGSGTGSQPENLAISPGGRDLYVANHADGTVSTFSIGAGGALTAQGAPVPSGTTLASGPQGIAISPSGQNLYVTNENESTVSAFSIGPGGALAPVGTSGPISGSTLAAQPFGAAVSPDGQVLYVANFALGAVSTFSIGPGGALAPEGPLILSGSSTSSGAYELVVSPDRGPLAAYAAMVSPSGPTAVFGGQPSVAESAPIGAYAWQFGDGARATGPLVAHTFPRPGTYTVTLTVTGTDGCSISGPFTGQSPDCTFDPGASFSHAVTVPAPPSASHIYISGVARGKPKLSFTLSTGMLAPSLASIAVRLPPGLALSAGHHDLTHHLIVTGADGKPTKFTAAIRHGALAVTLTSVQMRVRVTVASPALSASSDLVGEVKRHRHLKLKVRLKLTDAARYAVNLVIKASAG